jgi:hypothetical protein
MDTKNTLSKLDDACNELLSVCSVLREEIKVGAVSKIGNVKSGEYNYNTNSPEHRDNKPYSPKKRTSRSKVE